MMLFFIVMLHFLVLWLVTSLVFLNFKINCRHGRQTTSPRHEQHMQKPKRLYLWPSEEYYDSWKLELFLWRKRKISKVSDRGSKMRIAGRFTTVNWSTTSDCRRTCVVFFFPNSVEETTRRRFRVRYERLSVITDHTLVQGAWHKA